MINSVKLMVASHSETVVKHFSEITIIFTTIMTVFSYFLGGWDNALKVLLLMVFLDILTGVIVAFAYEERFSSKRLREGFGTKVMYLIVVAVGHGLDSVFFADAPVLRTLACWFYVATEASSILENMARMGVPVPKFITDKLEQLRENIDKGKK